jgi:hypothetical protein
LTYRYIADLFAARAMASIALKKEDVMRKALVLAGMLCVVFLSVGDPVALAQGAEKAVMLRESHGFCDFGATSGEATTSFAVIGFPSNGTVQATIKLHKMAIRCECSQHII